MTRAATLENAPPVLAFTTVALGGFRGLIANILWMRANDLQSKGRYFEMVQLADWITKLEPHFAQVWVMQAWNMAYNISVKFPGFDDRWRWVQRGIELLRDQGLRYNPNEILLYRELSWFFQHKMGQNMDNAHFHYKTKWAEQMQAVLGGATPDFALLLNPQTPEASNRVDRLRNEFKMDPNRIQEVEQQYGPLDWRLPESHAIYWAAVGLTRARAKDLISLRRAIYQSMLLATLHGRLSFVDTAEGRTVRLSPNLDLTQRTHDAFQSMRQEDESNRNVIGIAHQNYLKQVVYLMYAYNRQAESARWFQVLRTEYPEAVPPNLTAEEFALEQIAGSIASMGYDRTKTVLEGLLIQHYFSLALGEEDRAAGVLQMAQHLWTYHQSIIGQQKERLSMPPLREMQATVLEELLKPGSMDAVLAARLRTLLGLPAPPSPEKK